MDRWAVYIDIEGFSALYPEGNDALWALSSLMLAIHKIGVNVYPEPPERLFSHQLGDGFLIVSDFHEKNLERAVSIAIVLMKYIAYFGVFARASIAEGDLSDIVGCYSSEVLSHKRADEETVVTMGAGLMTICPIMGTALINAVAVDKTAPKGPMLTISKELARRIPKNIILKQIEHSNYSGIDWVHTENTFINSIINKAKIRVHSPKDLELLIERYLKKHSLPAEWVTSCKLYLGIKNA